jgi:hypothetical protein
VEACRAKLGGFSGEIRLVNPEGHPVLGLFTGYQFVKNRQDLLAIKVGTLEFLPDRLLVAVAEHELVQEFDWNVDIAAKRFGGVSAQE